MDDVLQHLFYPRGVALIGASSDPAKIGGRALAQNRELGYTGRLYPVNPNAAEIQGYPAYPSLATVPDPVDCAIVALPAPAVPDAIAACAARGVPLAVVFSTGFAETGAAGRRLQERVAALARDGGVRLLGPNSMGALSVDGAFSATFTSLGRSALGDAWRRPGPVGVATQSGAVGTQILALFARRGLGVTKWVATGNQSDLDLADCIDHLARDAVTRVIAVYVEGGVAGDRLRAALERARVRRKPVVLLKVGRSALGAAAAATHTASIAGADRVYAAVLRRHRVHRAETLEELVDVVAACCTGRFPARPELAVVAGSGGIGVMVSDACAQHGLAMPALPDALRADLERRVPQAATRNPVDLNGPGMNDMPLLADTVDRILADGGHAAVLLYLAHNGLIPERMETLHEHLVPCLDRHPGAVVGLIANLLPEWRDRWQRRGFLVHEEPARAVAAVAALARLGQGFAAAAQAPPPALPDGALPPAAGAGGERAAKRLVASLGIPVVAERLVHSAEAACDAAVELAGDGAPVALKIASPDIAHKADAGGVRLGARTRDAIAADYARLREEVAAAAPGARIEGMLVAPLVEGGVETIAGIQRDPVFGPVVLFGLGGLFVEVYEDVALRVAPFDEAVAREMITEVKGYPLLAGARGRPPADVDALAHALARLSAYAERHRDTLESLDINPLIVLPRGAGVIAVDALVLARSGGAENGNGAAGAAAPSS